MRSSSASRIAVFFCALLLSQIALQPEALDAQILDKLKNKAKEALAKSAADKTAQLLRTAVRCVVDDAECVKAAKAARKPVILTDATGTVLTDAKGQPVTDLKQLPPEQQAQIAQKAAAEDAAAQEAALKAAPPATAPPPQTLGQPAKAAPSSQAQPPEVRRITLPPENRSWENDPSVAKVKDHFLMNPRYEAGVYLYDLWSVATDQLVTRDYAAGVPRLVAGRPDMLIYGAEKEPTWGFAPQGLMVAPAKARPTYQPNMAIEMCLPPYACEKKAIGGRGHVGPMLSKDYRRVIYLQNGDVWRAETDYTAGSIINKKQVTKVGVLSHEKVSPLHWYENTLLLTSQLSAEKPFIKIDLVSGEIVELPRLLAFQGSVFANPSGSRLCSAHAELIACYDLRTGKESRISLVNTPANGGVFLSGGTSSQRADLGGYWADDETLIGVASGVVRVDFRTGRAETLFLPAMHNNRLEGVAYGELLPGDRHLFLHLTADTRPRTHRLLRVGVEDGAVATLPEGLIHNPEVDARGVWLDANLHLYSRQQGGLSEMGTWLYDVNRGSAIRICNLPGVSQLNMYFPHRKTVYFVSYAAGGGIYKSQLASDDCRKIAPYVINQGGALNSLRQPAIDLRMGVSGEALWKMTQPSKAVAVQEKSAAPPAEGLERVIQETENLPQKLRDEAQAAYRHLVNLNYNNYFDPACLALEFVDWRREHPQGQDQINELWAKASADIDPQACKERSRIVTWARGTALSYLPAGPDREATATCVGETMADEVMQMKAINPSYLNGRIVPLTIACQEKLRKTGSSQTPAHQQPAASAASASAMKNANAPPAKVSSARDGTFAASFNPWKAATGQTATVNLSGHAVFLDYSGGAILYLCVDEPADWAARPIGFSFAGALPNGEVMLGGHTPNPRFSYGKDGIRIVLQNGSMHLNRISDQLLDGTVTAQLQLMAGPGSGTHRSAYGSPTSMFEATFRARRLPGNPASGRNICAE